MLAAPAFARLVEPRAASSAATPAVAIALPWAVPVDEVPGEGPQDEVPQVMRVLVVAGDPLARTGLAALVAAMPDCRVVGELPDDAELPDAVERRDPDVVLWDLGQGEVVPDRGSLGDDATPILLLAPRELPRVSSTGIASGGVLPRDTDVPTLAAALRAVTRGLVVFDPAFTTAAAPSRDQGPVEPTEALTRREAEVLQSLAAGLPNKLIAERLGISEHTVRFHLNSIFGKLDAHTRTEAVSRAARIGLIVL